jgi:chromosome segregation ATPase
MFRWFSPFVLPQQAIEKLAAAGGQAQSLEEAGREDNLESPLLLIYPPPHGALGPPELLLNGYRRLLRLASRGQLIHLERLWNLPIENGKSLVGSEPPTTLASLEQPAPLQALVTLALLREVPALLDAYLDLELSSQLGGSQPDSDYLIRLREASPVEALLASLHDDRQEQNLARLQEENQSIREQLNHGYEELEQLMLAERSQQEQLLNLQRELELQRTRCQQWEQNSAEREAELQRGALALQEVSGRLAAEEERARQRQQTLEASERQADDLRRNLQQQERERETVQNEIAELHNEMEQLFLTERQNIAELDRLGRELQGVRRELADSEQERSAGRLTLEHLRNDFSTQEGLLARQSNQLGDCQSRLEQSVRELQETKQELERMQGLQAEIEYRSEREQALMAKRQSSLEQELGSLQECLQRDRIDLDQARERTERLLGSLHQTEEELEHYFLQSQHGRQLADAQRAQLQRAAGLLRRMAALKGIPAGSLPPPPIQIMALLEGYRHSLKRAERLLTREFFPGEAGSDSE